MRYITEEMLEKFSEKLVDDEKSPATVKKYVRDAEDFCMRMGRKGVDKYAVLEYKEYLIERYAPASVNSKLSSLNSFFEFNEWYELRVKTLKIQRRLFADKELELIKSEYERLLTAARESDDERLFLLIQTICSCGLRVSEVRFVTLEAVKKCQAKIRCEGKIRQIFFAGWTVPYAAQICEVLRGAQRGGVCYARWKAAGSVEYMENAQGAVRGGGSAARQGVPA